MCSFKCRLHEVIKGEQTRVALDSRVTQQMGHQFFLPMVLRWRALRAEAPLILMHVIISYICVRQRTRS